MTETTARSTGAAQRPVPGVRTLLVLCLLLLSGFSQAAKPSSLFTIKGLDYLHTVLTNPVEALMHEARTGQTAAEEQHTIPQSAGGSDDYVVYWIRSNHTVSDRWRNRPGLTDWSSNPALRILAPHTVARENLSRAYLMGTHGIKLSLFFHEYGRDVSRPVITTFDGASNLLYIFAWHLNMPQKIVKQVVYIVTGNETSLLYLFDVAITVVWFVLLLRIWRRVPRVTFTVLVLVPVLIGTVLHPVTTVMGLAGLFYLTGATVLAAVGGLIPGVGLLLTLPTMF